MAAVLRHEANGWHCSTDCRALLRAWLEHCPGACQEHALLASRAVIMATPPRLAIFKCAAASVPALQPAPHHGTNNGTTTLYVACRRPGLRCLAVAFFTPSGSHGVGCDGGGAAARCDWQARPMCSLAISAITGTCHDLPAEQQVTRSMTAIVGLASHAIMMAADCGHHLSDTDRACPTIHS
jgi:hypothetical protein